MAADPGERVMALREHFVALFGVGVALGAVLGGALLHGELARRARHRRPAQRGLRARRAQSPEFFETTQTGEVLSRLTTDTTLVQTVVGSSLSMGLRNAVMGIGALAMLVVTNPYVMTQVLGILVLVVLPTLLLRPARAPALARQPGPRGRLERDRRRGAERDAGGAELHAGGARGGALRRRDRARLRHRACGARRVRALLVAFIISATFGALLWGLYQGTQAVLARRDQRRPPRADGGLRDHPGRQRGGAVRGLRRPAARRRRDRAADGAAGSRARRCVSPAAPRRAAGRAAAARRCELDDVTFRYPSRPQHAGAGATSAWRCAPGETVALVGPSGAGKSTVFQLLLRFYDAAARRACGSTACRSRDAALAELRARIGIVPQDSVIFSTSAMENIRYGRPGRERRRGDRRRDARPSPHDFISALPEGYDTFLGERGVRLSGGQRQRIAIARAMLKNPPLLLLDEATSALDAESERMVQAALESAMRDRTTLVIAHRLATVQQADRIVVLDARPHRRDRAPTPSWWRAAGCMRGWRRCSSRAGLPFERA